MKHVLRLIMIAGVLSLGITSCDDDSPTGPIEGTPENPIESFVNSLNITDTYIDDDYYEFGVIMEFQSDGIIREVCVKMPDDGTYPVTIWNLADSSIVTTTSVTVNADEVTYASIGGDITVEAGVRIAVTVNSNDWYEYNNTNDDPIYPVTLGNVTILQYGYKQTDMTEFPDVFQIDAINQYYAGDAGIIFIPLID